MLGKLYSSTNLGVDPIQVEIEVDARNGLPGQTIVGLPDNAVKESKERVMAAIKNAGFEMPTNKFVTINLAPANIRKSGSIYDLAIALGILQTTGQLSQKVPKVLILGELGLGGECKAVEGVLIGSILAKKNDFDAILVPKENYLEACLINQVPIIPISSLKEAVDWLIKPNFLTTQRVEYKKKSIPNILDFREVKGQSFARRAIEIAASGGHNILMVGPPGCGKSMLAKRIPSILPELNNDEMIEVAKIYSISGKLKNRPKNLSARPYRSPHYTISYAGLVGGTSWARPGELSLAHNGVLFLDEFPEFNRQAIECLRQPLEDGQVTVSRANFTLTYPASFMLVASANPCPCGYEFHPYIECKCSPYTKERYQKKLSGPILDRFDMIIELVPLDERELFDTKCSESSIDIQKRVLKARDVQKNRLINNRIYTNSKMSVTEQEKYCFMDSECEQLLKIALAKYQLSARVVHKILRVSRTIADLDNSNRIKTNHLSEAINYRIKSYV